MAVQILSFEKAVERLRSLNPPYHSNYLAMYSSWYGGIIVDPRLMMVPIDDHLVHRGDGAFEAFKCTNWYIYALERHLKRLDISTSALGLLLPVERSRLIEIITETIRAGKSANCIIRLFVSRGPGGFSADPYESVAAQIYVVVTNLHPAPRQWYEEGVTLATTTIAVKPGPFASVKSCNYIQNVLMKKEATDKGADFSVSLDTNGYIAESATENLGIITRQGEFLVPRFQHIMRGITVTRALELARSLMGRELTAVAEADISPAQAESAAEMLVFATPFDVLPAVAWDGKKINDGKPGPVYRKLLELLRLDSASSMDMLTPVQ